MEILDKKSNRMSRANAGVFECNEFPDLQRILDFLSLRNLLSNELFFTFCEFATVPFFFIFYLIYFTDFEYVAAFSPAIFPNTVISATAFPPILLAPCIPPVISPAA